MKANPLLLAVAVLAALGGAVWYTRENPPPDEDETPTIVKLEGKGGRCRKSPSRGRAAIPSRSSAGKTAHGAFGAGIGVPADDSSIGFMITSLASLNADRVVSENVSDWSPYALEDPALKVAYKLKEGEGGRGLVRQGNPHRLGRLRAAQGRSAAVYRLQL